MGKRRFITALFTALLLLPPLLQGCATNPATGARELRLVSDRAANNMGKKGYP